MLMFVFSSCVKWSATPAKTVYCRDPSFFSFFARFIFDVILAFMASDLEMWNAINVVSVLVFLLIWNLITTWCALCSLNNVQKNQFNNHLLVELVFYNNSPAFFIWLKLKKPPARWDDFCVWISSRYCSSVKTIQKNFFTKLNFLSCTPPHWHGFFLWFLHLRLVLLFLINLIENYKTKCLPRGLNPEMVFINSEEVQSHIRIKW